MPQVTLTTWQTKNAVVQVCSQAVIGNPGDAPTLLNCATIPQTSQGVPVAVAIPPGARVHIQY